MVNFTPITRIVVCGAVDDGKSTLIGRLLAETGSIPLDELSSAQDSQGVVDYSRLTDGLESEREQGITIDVAFRYLALPGGQRALLADSPGHEQYTSNMAVAASTATCALVVVDTTRGIREQTLRHISVCQLMGIQNFVVALNKIDAYEKSEAKQRVDSLKKELSSRFASGHKSTDNDPEVAYVSVSGLRGDNVSYSDNKDSGESLLDALTNAVGQSTSQVFSDTLRVPIQYVTRVNDERFYNGNLASGKLEVGQELCVWPSGETAQLEELYVNGKLVESAPQGTAISFKLSREVDLGRGDIVLSPIDFDTAPSSRAHLANLVWLDNSELDTYSSYLLRVGPLEIPVKCSQVRSVLNLDSGEERPAHTLHRNELGRVEISADRPFFLDSYQLSRSTGGFILCERLTGATVAAGMGIHALQRESEVSRHHFSISREIREQANGVRSGVLWLTGLPGSGKSSIADEVEQLLFRQGIRSYILDGDAIRQTLCEDLGFSAEDRTENVRRVSHTAQLMMDAGLVVLVSLVSPFEKDRLSARELFADSDFAEVFIDTPIEVCKSRDPKGLYAKSTGNDDNQMTGIGQNYEKPQNPEIYIDGTQPISESAQEIVSWVVSRRLV